MSIPTSELRALFTNNVAAIYKERIAPTSFLRGFFPTVTEPTKYVSIEVERMGEKIAVDVLRGSDGNRNAFSKSTEKIILPPLWNEYTDVTDLDLYDVVLGALNNGSPAAPLFSKFADVVAKKIGLLEDMIERAKELQAAQVLLDGIVVLQNGDNIDFKRKAASKVDLGSAGGYWTTGATDVFAQLEAGCNFIRTVGRTAAAEYNLIMGSAAMTALLKNTTFLARQDLTSMKLDAVTGPVRNGVGASYHGTISAGSYIVHLWGYPQFFDAESGGAYTSTPYIDPKKVILLPSQTNFIFAHAAVPQLIDELPQQGDYVMYEHIDRKKTTHEFGTKSAAVPVPVAVDTIWTGQAIA